MNKPQKTISEIMTRTLCLVGADQPVIEALTRMRSKSVSSVLVGDSAAVEGIITERDIVNGLHASADFTSMSCAELMQSPVLSVGTETPCLDAYHRMAGRGIRHLMVTDKSGKTVGLASEGDLMRDFGIEYFMNFKDVGSVMSTDVCMVGETAIVADAIEMMIERHQSCAVVVDAHKHPLGILTERDVVRLCSDHERSERLIVGQVMHSPVRTVKAPDLLHEAVAAMAAARIRRLVVVDDAGAVCGLLTHHDIVRGLEGGYAAYLKALADIQSRGLVPTSTLVDEKLVLATLLRSSTGTALLAADLDYRIWWVTPTVAQVLELNAADIVGADVREALKTAGWPDAHGVLVEAALADGAQSFDASIAGNRMALSAQLMLDAQERPCGFLVRVAIRP